MNEKISKEQSVSRVTEDATEIISLVAERMLQTRPSKEIEFRSYIRQSAVYPKPELGPIQVDLRKIYPDASENDTVFCVTKLTADRKQEISIGVWGNVRVYFKGKEVLNNYNDIYEFPLHYVDVTLEKGYNELVIECVCEKERFEFWILPSLPFYRGMWAKDYLFCTRTTLPQDEYEGEEGIGISQLYVNAGENETQLNEAYNQFVLQGKKCIYPEAPESDSTISFGKLYGEEKGVCAYALTYSREDCNVNILSHSQTVIFINKKVVANVDKNESFYLHLKKGDEVLIKSLRSENDWGFSDDGGDRLHLPFLKANRSIGTRWILVGSFGDAENADLNFGPEQCTELHKTYRNIDGKRCYWRFAQKDTFLRPYLDSSFYSQWYYALMVGHYGLLAAAKTLGNKKYLNYFLSSMEIMAKYFDYMIYDKENFGQTPFMQRSSGMEVWDNIGTMGMNMLDAYEFTGDSLMLAVSERLAIAANKNIPRFEDGTFNREKTMWADDLFMSCPFLVRFGRIIDDPAYFSECVNQILGFKKKLFMEDKKIFSHIFFIEEKTPNRVPWGRGNGWIMVAMSEVIKLLPENFDGKDELIMIFREFAQGLAELQDKSGMWHQVLDRSESYLETSGTAMFVIGLCRGVRYGWIDASYKEVAEKAWSALCERTIDNEGNIYGVCKGSGCRMDAEYYCSLDTVKNDDHGTGIILAAACEIVKLREVE